MRTLSFLFLPVALCLTAQDDLPLRLAKIQGMATDPLQDLQGRLAAAELPAEARAYHEAYLNYALVTRLREKDPKGAEALLDRTMKALEPRQDGESLALLGACIGLKLGFSPMSGMTLAPKASRLFEKATQASPASPRVRLFHGSHVLHTPAFFGGGPKKALPILEGAVQTAEAEAQKPPTDPWAPRWGRVEAYAWLAIAQASAGLQTEAETSLAKGRALDPEHGFLNYAVRRVAAAKAKS